MVLLKFFAFYCGMLYVPFCQAYMNLFLNQHDVMRLLGKKLYAFQFSIFFFMIIINITHIS